MVKHLFECQECRAVYEVAELAKLCEDFCRKNNACNISYISRSVGHLKWKWNIIDSNSNTKLQIFNARNK